MKKFLRFDGICFVTTGKFMRIVLKQGSSYPEFFYENSVLIDCKSVIPLLKVKLFAKMFSERSNF